MAISARRLTHNSPRNIGPFRIRPSSVGTNLLCGVQLIHELREGLDIASEMRADFSRHVRAALGGRVVGPGSAKDLALVAQTFDTTVETILKV